MKKSFFKTAGILAEKLPEILEVYKPRLINKDICSFSAPDYLLETAEGPVLIEIKTSKDLKRSIKDGKEDLLFYNSLLRDLELSGLTFRGMRLARPVKSLLINPRYGTVEEFNEVIPNFREIGVEIWKIKRAALVENVLPSVKPVSSICSRCAYKKFCREGEYLEMTKPPPIIYALAEREVEPKDPDIKPPKEFWRTYFLLRRRLEQGYEIARIQLEKMDAYLRWLQEKKQERLTELVYREMSNEFESWGGLNFLKRYNRKIRAVSYLLFPRNKAGDKDLRIAKKRWFRK